MINYQSLIFVSVSDLFKDCPQFTKIFFDIIDHDFSWGNNNFTLISSTVLLNAIDNMDYIDYNDDDEKEIVIKQIDIVKDRIKSCLSSNVYIDLES